MPETMVCKRCGMSKAAHENIDLARYPGRIVAGYDMSLAACGRNGFKPDDPEVKEVARLATVIARGLPANLDSSPYITR